MWQLFPAWNLEPLRFKPNYSASIWPTLARRVAVLTAIAFNLLSQYASSPSSVAHWYADITGSSAVVAEISPVLIVEGWPGWVGWKWVAGLKLWIPSCYTHKTVTHISTNSAWHYCYHQAEIPTLHYMHPLYLDLPAFVITITTC